MRVGKQGEGKWLRICIRGRNKAGDDLELDNLAK